MAYIKPYIQEGQRTPSKINAKQQQQQQTPYS